MSVTAFLRPGVFQFESYNAQNTDGGVFKMPFNKVGFISLIFLITQNAKDNYPYFFAISSLLLKQSHILSIILDSQFCSYMGD